MNNINVAGNLTRDPELRFTPNGQAVTKFGLAVNRAYVNRAGERVDAVDFLNVQTWGKLAENVAESLHKGSHVVVAGRLQSRSWEAEDGSKHNAVEIHADEVAASLRWATVSSTPSTAALDRELDTGVATDEPAPAAGAPTLPAQPDLQATGVPAAQAGPGPAARQVAGITAASFPAGASAMAPAPIVASAGPAPAMVPMMQPAAGLQR